jgi:hypothetical protein
VLLVVMVVFLLMWAGAILLIDASVRRRDRSMAERLASYQDGSVADEAHCWLDSR